MLYRIFHYAVFKRRFFLSFPNLAAFHLFIHKTNKRMNIVRNFPVKRNIDAAAIRSDRIPSRPWRDLRIDDVTSPPRRCDCTGLTEKGIGTKREGNPGLTGNGILPAGEILPGEWSVIIQVCIRNVYDRWRRF